MLIFCVVWFIGSLVLSLQQASHLFGDGQNWVIANTLCLFWQEHQPCVGQSGSQEMVSFLMKVKNKLLAGTISGNILAPILDSITMLG
jgi:hypothetical protein